MSAKRCKSQTPDSAEWVDIPGYRFRYQINREAVVRKELESGEWYVLKPYISGRTRACVKMRTADNRKVDVPVVWLWPTPSWVDAGRGTTLSIGTGRRWIASW